MRVTHLGRFVCMSVLMRNSQTSAPIDLIFLHKKYCTRGSVLSDDLDLDSRMYLRILHRWEIGQNMPSKYSTTSNVCYDENMR